MLQLRIAQVRTFDSLHHRSFLLRLREHLRGYFPIECQALDEQGLERVTRLGLDQAKAFGLAKERDLVKFLNLIFVFGEDIGDCHPSLLRCFTRPGLGSPSLRLERAYELALGVADDGLGLLELRHTKQPQARSGALP